MLANRSSMIGKAMLKIIVIMMIEPMLIYQSAVRSVYFPWKRNPTSVIPIPSENFMLRRIMMRPMFMMSKNDRLTVKLMSWSVMSRWHSKFVRCLKMNETTTL